MNPQEVLGRDLGVMTVIAGIIMIFKDIQSKRHNSDILGKEQGKECEMENRLSEKTDTQNTNHIQTLNEMIKELEEDVDHKDMTNALNKMTISILSVLKNYPLEIKEEHYLTYTLPLDLTESLKIFMKLTEKNQNIMKPKMMELLVSKQEDLENHYIHRGQNQWMESLEKRIKLTESRDW